MKVITHSNKVMLPKRPRTTMACERCRRLKARCTNNNDREPCETCKRKNTACEYNKIGSSTASESPSTPTSPPILIPITQAEGSTNQTVGITNVSSNVADCGCDNSEEHGCVVKQIPRGQFSEEMDALIRYNAEKYPGM